MKKKKIKELTRLTRLTNIQLIKKVHLDYLIQHAYAMHKYRKNFEIQDMLIGHEYEMMHGFDFFNKNPDSAISMFASAAYATKWSFSEMVCDLRNKGRDEEYHGMVAFEGSQNGPRMVAYAILEIYAGKKFTEKFPHIPSVFGISYSVNEPKLLVNLEWKWTIVSMKFKTKKKEK